MIDSTDFAYAAGYIDGDGCFSIGKYNSENRTRFRSQIIINSTEIENLQWFRKKFGGSISRKTSRGKETHKLIHRYTIGRDHITKILGISDFLVERKEEFIIFENFRNSNSRKKDIHLIDEMKVLKEKNGLITYSIKEDLESIRNTIIPTLDDFAYLAGFIDAECCLNIQKHKTLPNPTYKALLQCNNTKSPCFFWLSKRFGGQFHFIERKSKNPTYQNQMCWRVSSASLANILPKIYPFLNHKKAVCAALIDFSKTIFSSQKGLNKRTSEFQNSFKPILDERERIFHKIQSLNKKGI